jgi:hypothetical protein
LVYGSCGCQSAREKGRVSAGCGGMGHEAERCGRPGAGGARGSDKTVGLRLRGWLHDRAKRTARLVEGGKAEQEEIEEAVREAGYEIFKVSS